MSILNIVSSNVNLSYILEKNPATIKESGKAFRREIRKGVVYGWFPHVDNQEFRLWFKDAEGQTSFGEGLSDEFEYLDCSRYGSPYLPIAIITNALSTASKKQHELDVPEEGGKQNLTSLSFTIKVPNPRYLDQIAIHYKDVAEIVSTQLQGKYRKVIVCAPTVFAALNITQVVCLLQCLCDSDTYVRMDTAAAEKYVKIFNRANAPYYPRYLFQMKAISNVAMFNKLKADLSGEGMSLTYGDTRQQRFDAVKAELTGGNTLVDIGCGEMFQSLRLASKYETVWALDADAEQSDNNKGKVEGRKIENINAQNIEVDEHWIESEVNLFDGADVLLTEVLEHIDYEKSLSTLTALLKTDFNKVIVTCPNKDFNVHYALNETEMRHPDHKWEPTFEEFCDLMAGIAAETNCTVECKGIGDCVNDSSTSIMAVFTKQVKE